MLLQTDAERAAIWEHCGNLLFDSPHSNTVYHVLGSWMMGFKPSAVALIEIARIYPDRADWSECGLNVLLRLGESSPYFSVWF